MSASPIRPGSALWTTAWLDVKSIGGRRRESDQPDAIGGRQPREEAACGLHRLPAATRRDVAPIDDEHDQPAAAAPALELKVVGARPRAVVRLADGRDVLRGHDAARPAVDVSVKSSPRGR